LCQELAIHVQDRCNRLIEKDDVTGVQSEVLIRLEMLEDRSVGQPRGENEDRYRNPLCCPTILSAAKHCHAPHPFAQQLDDALARLEIQPAYTNRSGSQAPVCTSGQQHYADLSLPNRL